MLERMRKSAQARKSAQSLLVYVLFGIIITVFIINFGPHSRSGGGGCDGGPGGDESAATVAGNDVPSSAFRYAFMLMGGANQPPQMLKMRRFKETVMDRLLERELLAEQAQRMGFAVDEDDVHKLLLDGRIVGLGLPHTVSRIQKDGVFNYDLFKNFSQYELGLSPEAFVAQQERELLAARMRDFLRATVTVSPEELRADFESKNRQVNLEYVRFPSRKYEAQIEPTPAELAAYMQQPSNATKLKEAFDQRKSLYTDIPGEVRVREIVVKVPNAAGDGEPTDAERATARTRAEAVVARLAEKGEPFAKVAREVSEDPDSATRGGELGWRRKGGLGLGDADEAKLFSARPGQVVGPFKTSRGEVILQAGPSRHGTLSYDDVKEELAEERIKQDRAVELARQKAEAALTLARAPDNAGKSFKDLFPGDAAGAGQTKAEGTTKDKAEINKKKGLAAAAASSKAPGAVASSAGPGGAATLAPGEARAEETGLFSRRGSIVEQVGDSPALAKAAFELKPESPVAGPFEIAGSYVVVRLKERKDPDFSELDKKKDELRGEAELIKWNEVFTDWVQNQCREEKAAGRLSVNRSILRYEDSKDPPPYEPCSREPMFPRRPS
jgi:peptidyl-prolyl cis-trans isomerase D